MENLEKAPNVPPFVRYCAMLIPTVFDDSLSYYEALCALSNWVQKNLVEVVNHNAEVTEEYIQLTNDLKAYVENYFENLDVQEEINNKLDDMVEAGTLQEIIASYIQANVAWSFDSVADMKVAENFINGSYAQTLGYHAKNDGGASLYKIRTITNEDVVDEGSIIALSDNTLIAELIPINKTITPEMFGAYGDNSHDDTTAFQKACNYLNTVGGGTLLCVNTYIIASEIDISNFTNIKFDGNGKGKLVKPDDNNTNIFFGDSAKKITFSNLLFDGNRPETLDYTWPHIMNGAIICRYGEDITLENCTFDDFFYGVCTATSENSHNARIDKCNFNGCGSDIDLYGKPLVSITNVSSNGCTGNSIQFEPSGAEAHETVYNYLEEPNINSMSVNNTIQGCSVVNCSGIAVNVHSGSINIVITNNMFANCSAGIYCYHAGLKNIVISNNTFLNMTGERTNDNAYATYPEGSAISLTRSLYGAIVSNNIINHARTGIFVYGSSTVGNEAKNILIKGNSVQYCKTSGISLVNTKNSQVSDNYLYNNAIGLDGGTTYYKNSGIYLQGCSYINCDSNYCMDTSELSTRQRACVYIDRTTCTDISVSNCTGINMVENPVNNDAATGGCYADGSKVYTSPFTAITNTN